MASKHKKGLSGAGSVLRENHTRAGGILENDQKRRVLPRRGTVRDPARGSPLGLS